MHITNKHNLDAPFVRALEGGEHVHTGDISVTRLIAPIQQTVLMERHRDEISMDASEAIWMFLGQVGHGILEGFAAAGDTTEELMAIWIHENEEMEALPIDKARKLIETPHEGVVLSMKIDRYADNELVDWKLTKTWSHIYGSRIEEWTKQLSIYRLGMEVHGIKIDDDAAHISEILIDWQEGKTMQRDYPERAMYKVPIKLWSISKTKGWVINKTAAYAKALLADDAHLPACSAEERWARPAKWAVYKNKQVKKASRLLTSEAEAKQYIKSHTLGGGAIVRHRPGTNARCSRYCLVKDFCSQWKKIQEATDEAAQS